MTQLALDLRASIAAKDSGIALAALHNPDFLSAARKIARDIASVKGKVTADDVREVAYRTDDFPWPHTQNAWGALFKSEEWQFTGERVKSKHVKNHARELKVWVLR